MGKKGKRMKVEKKNKISYLMLIFFLCIMVFSGKKIYDWYIENQKNNEVLEGISKGIIIDEEKENDNIDKYSIDFEKFVSENSHTVAWLKVNNTKIQYPVVKQQNNEYYLTHSFNDEINSAGWVFADYRNKMDGTDKNIIIYGHNRRDGTMFGTLRDALNPEWYNNEENRKIMFFTKDDKSIYEIFSIYKIEKEDYYIQTSFTNESFREFLNTIKKRSINDFNMNVTQEDKILTLSTCDNNNKYRVVIHAKKI